MRADIAHHDGKIVAEAQSWPNFSTLTFRQGKDALQLSLPPRMAACVAMIVEAFNAHMSEDAKTIVAQGGDIYDPRKHPPFDHTEHPPFDQFIGDAGKSTADRLAELVRHDSLTPVIVADGLGRFGHHPDPATDFEVEVGDIEAEAFNLTVGVPSHETKETLLDRIDRALDFRVGGVTTSVKAKDALRRLRAAFATVRIPGENAITPGDGRHVDE